jgi:hypothetical protein
MDKCENTTTQANLSAPLTCSVTQTVLAALYFIGIQSACRLSICHIWSQRAAAGSCHQPR